MSASRSQRLADLFTRAADLDAAARRELLDRECGDDVDLRREVERLLAADSGPAAALLDTAFVDRRLEPGELVAGRYRVVRKVGEGGMGVVFEAEQLEPRRRVALKCIRAGWLDVDAQQRFRREAEALGRLQHPGIAQVFEAGVADGDPPLPYLAMEFVDGVQLAEFARGLPLRARLELLAAVAEAVGHAHERGVVHRDLKPHNVLVETGSAGPRPRVLDFGVARFADGDAALRTRTHQIVGTLAYLSPEQVVHGSAVADPRSDVYSLGVTAYEVLAGRLPLALGDKGLAEAALTLRDQEPDRLDRLVPALRGDVATIVHKALAKDPLRRYADARAFAADLRRHLAAEPITARPASALYVASRLVRRHRGLFGGLVAAFAALTVGLVLALAAAARAADARDRAERRTGDLRDLVRTLLRDVDAELQKVAGSTPARRTLIDAGLRHAAAMVEDAEGSPDMLLEVASLYEQLGNVQGRPGVANLGDPEGALAAFDRALALVDRAKALAPDRSRFYVSRQQVLQDRDTVLRALGRNDDRMANLQEMRREAEEMARRWPGADADLAVARTGADIGRMLADRGDIDGALVRYREYRAQLERHVAESPADDRNRRGNESKLRVMSTQIGMLLERRGDDDGARAAYAAAVAQAERMAQQWPDAVAVTDLASALRTFATFLAQRKDAAGALDQLQRARDLLAPMLQTGEPDYDLLRLSGSVDFGIGDALCKLGRREEGIDVLRAYVARVATMVAGGKNPQLERDLVPGQEQLATSLARIGSFDEAERMAVAAVDLCRRRATASPSEALAQDDLLGALGVHAFVCELAASDRKDLDADDLAALRRRAADLLEAQLVLLRELDAGKRLDPRRRSMFDELPPRITALRAAPR